MRGDLSRVADGFRCRQCDGTIQEVDLAEDLMVDGETYECVKSFCYLGDTLDGDCQFHRGNMYAKRRYTVRLPVQTDNILFNII